MKKRISILLVLMLIFSSFSVVFAAVPADVAGTGSEEAVGVLMSLGVVNGYEDGSYKPEQVVTRAEMAKLIIVALGLEKEAAAGVSKFPDMNGAIWAQGFVKLAADLGVVLGYPDGTFQPLSGTVTYDEATTMILRALGYTDKSLGGTWPSNYLVKAKLLGVLDGMTGKTGGANRGDIAQMLFHAIALPIGTVGASGQWNATGSDSMLSRLGAELKAAAVIKGDEASAINLRSFVGAYAETYLNSDSEIIALTPKSEFLTGSFDGTVFTVDNTDYTVSSTIAAAVKPVFTNGLADGTGKLSGFTGDTVTLAASLTGKAITKLYSIQSWTVSADGAFVKADATDITASQQLMNFDFVLASKNVIDVNSFELIGVKTLSNISTGDIVYVYADSKSNIRKIAVGIDEVSGKITKINSAGDYTIGGKVYAVTDKSVTTSIAGAAGDTVTAYLDAFGDIYKMKVTSGQADAYAIVLAVANGTGTLSGFEPAIDLFLSNGSEKAYKVDESKASLKSHYFTNTVTPKVWMSAPAAGTIIRYGVDDNGDVDAIAESTGLSATSNITSKGYFNGYAIEAGAPIFTYSGSDYSDKSNYSIKMLKDVLGMTGVTAKYAVDPDTSKIAAMLIESGIKTDDTYGVVTDRATNSSASGYEITFLVNGAAVTYDAKPAAYDTAGVDNTMLYKLNFNLAGEVATLTVPPVFVTVSGAVITDHVITSGSNTYTLDPDVVVYKWDTTDQVYKKGKIADITNGILYDVIGDPDQVYDIVILPPVI